MLLNIFFFFRCKLFFIYLSFYLVYLNFFHRAQRNRWKHIGPPPHNLIPVKGASHIIVCRGYIEFMINDQRAIDLLEWARHAKYPDEVFFSTLNHNAFLKVPGSYLGKY